ncbi:myomesin-1 isoform X2 [Phyllobates terribilis]|uniref:myomesin-1 isoform X2 n=1 Tax=Phyllobates terribilis TaxID=111132 RepID=UPI003CCB3909
MSLPFYQKRHQLYDRGYRSTELQSTLSQYHEEKQHRAAHSSHLGISSHRAIEDTSYKMSPMAKRSKILPKADKENEDLGYVVPVFRGRQVNVSGITDTEEERIMESAGYVARRKLLSTGEGISVSRSASSSAAHSETFQKKSRSVSIREKAERLALKKTLEETEEFHKKINEDTLLHAPVFIIKPRSHTVWETQNVKFHCTVSGWPEPRVTWYKNNVPINDQFHSEKYKIESGYGLHSLEIFKCDFEDTAQYHASAMNVKGESSSYASLVVKRYKGELDVIPLTPPRSEPFSFSVTPYGFATKFDIHFVDSFGVSFGKEGETLSLGSTVIVHPTIKRFQPEIQWYRNGVLVTPSKWLSTHWSGGHAMLTLRHLNKEDEGLYTLRVVMGEYYDQYSAYVFVRDGEPEVDGAPAAPLDVECLDANKDYVIISWKQPAVDGGSQIVGYFIDRCEVGTSHWTQCNDTPVKFARFPVTGLIEGRSYIFRVRAVNKTGISRPSRVSEPVAALDPADRARIRSRPSAPWTGQIIVTEEEPTEGIIPGPPSNLSVTEATKNYVVLSWKPPELRGHEGVMYYVEKSVAGTENWQRVNTEIPVKSPRFALFDLAEGKSYSFRVRSCNSAGVGEPSEATESTVVGDKLDIPNAPSNLVPTRNTDTSVVLTWTESKDARELVGYYIEASISGSGTWEPCNNNPVKGTRFVCHGLLTGENYILRVRAVNAAGLSGYSSDSEPIIVKAAIGGGLPHGACPELSSSADGLTDSPACWVVKHESTQHSPITDALPNSSDNTKNISPSKNGKAGPTGVSKISASNESDATTHSPQNEGAEHETVPSAPYDITVLESVRDSMVIGWKQPKFTGGVDIQGYYINYREVVNGVPGTWKEANIKAISDRAYRILNLKENIIYEFQVAACNIAGVGTPSQPSKPFKCEEWTIAVPGPPHELTLSEVRSSSMVLLWKTPVYTGRTPVTGFYVDIKEANAPEETWKGVNEKPTSNTYIKIQNVKEGVQYVLRVRAVNQAGVGKVSDVTDPVLAQTKPGTKEVYVEVDDNGVISLNFECDQLTPDSKFVWSKNYEAIGDDSSRVDIETKGGRTKISFKEPSEEDIGIYSCVVTETDGVSSSYTIDEEELKGLLQLSHDNKFPVVPLKSNLAVEILEKGQVRFWMQAEKLSGTAKANYVFNDKEIKHGEKYKMNLDSKTGIVEMTMEKLEDEDEGTFTFQIQDGKATNQSSLVLIGEVFEKLKKEARFQRQEWIRKQGPHFIEYLGWEVTPECNVLLKSKVANMKNDTSITWYKDEMEIMIDEKHDFKDGVCTLLITEVSRKDAGTYELILKDDRGKDKSVLKLKDSAFDDLMTAVCKMIAGSATQLKIQSNEEGIRVYSFVNYYVEDLKVIWVHNENKIKYTERVKSGVTGEMIWLQINEPTPSDKGKYVLEMFDGKNTHTKDLDLSGQAFDEAVAEFQRLKQAAIAEKNRARVVGGLPDVVTIQEGKALNLTCNIWGDPVPEVTWMKNERELTGDDHCILKFESGKYASFTITTVSQADSGKYCIRAKNKYGTETNDFTVSVFNPEGEEAAEEEAQTDAKKK